MMRASLLAAASVLTCTLFGPSIAAAAESNAGPANAATESHSGPVNAAVPNGLVVVVANKPDQPLNRNALANPYISGIALQIHWSDIEPVEGKPDWSRLDELFADAGASRKWIQLLIFPGFFSPPWALEGVKTEQFAIQYGPGKGSVEALPMPWDEVYLKRWFAFVGELRDRYGNSPALRGVAAAGPTSVSVEATLPGLPKDLKTWQADGYTPSKYIDAWKKVFRVYANDFPNQYISLSIGRGLNINDMGKIDDSEHYRSRQDIVDQAMKILGRRFAMQYSNLDGTTDPDVDGTGYVIGYNGRVVTGFQLRTSARNTGMGADGNPPLALRRSIDKGMQANSNGLHVNYLEIYEPDVAAADMQPVLSYGASLFAPKNPTPMPLPRRACGTRCK